MGEVVMKVFIFILAFVVTASEPTGSGLLHFLIIVALWAYFVALCKPRKIQL